MSAPGGVAVAGAPIERDMVAQIWAAMTLDLIVRGGAGQTARFSPFAWISEVGRIILPCKERKDSLDAPNPRLVLARVVNLCSRTALQCRSVYVPRKIR